MNPSLSKNNHICSLAIVGSTYLNSDVTLSGTSLMESKGTQMVKEHARRSRDSGSSLHSTALPTFSMPMNSAFVTARHRNYPSARAVCHAPRLIRTKQRSWYAKTLMGAKFSFLFSSAGLVGQGVLEGKREEVWIFSTIMRGKDWMNTMMFTRWRYRIDTRIGINRIHIEFLAKRTTSILQPLDLGIIACLKSTYKRKLASPAVDLIKDGYSKMLYRIDLKLSGMWVEDITSRIQIKIM